MLTLQVLRGEFTVHRLFPYDKIPPRIFESDFYSISRTADELSILCRSEIALRAGKSESGWACLKVLGPLDFALTGILSGIADVLAKAEISIFALSTFDTDYILVRAAKLDDAIQSLTAARYVVDHD